MCVRYVKDGFSEKKEKCLYVARVRVCMRAYVCTEDGVPVEKGVGIVSVKKRKKRSLRR